MFGLEDRCKDAVSRSEHAENFNSPIRLSALYSTSNEWFVRKYERQMDQMVQCRMDDGLVLILH